ncbi:MAG: hypothetical protein ACI3ZL_03245 [Candidatus Cryptobacteroides sp.]
MKYIIRSIKYFFYFAFLTAIIICALILIGAVEGNVDTMFRGGWNAIWKMLLLFAAVAAIYPKFGFITRDAAIAGPWSAIREDFIGFMRERHYEFEREEDGVVTFRYRGVAGRISRMYEDRISIDTKTEGMLMIEGLRKDVLRIAMGVENKYRPEN